MDKSFADHELSDAEVGGTSVAVVAGDAADEEAPETAVLRQGRTETAQRNSAVGGCYCRIRHHHHKTDAV